MTDSDTLRPFSTSSIISPHVALESLTTGSDMDQYQYPLPTSSSSSSAPNTSSTPVSPRPHSRTLDPNSNSKLRPAPPNGSGSGSGSVPGTPISPRYIVRAQFDFDASDPSALSFKMGDIIEVYTMLESGWWDGMLEGRRGWFPSNFVEELNAGDDEDEDDEEGEGGDDGGDQVSELSRSQDHAQSRGHDIHNHGLGLVGDQLDQERDMRMLETDDFGVPAHHRHRRNQSTASNAGMGLDELIRDQAGWASGAGLDDLAREMMDSNLDDEQYGQEQGDEDDDGKAFEAEALRRRKQRDSDDTGEFGMLRTPYTRKRMETDDTIRQTKPGPSGTSTKAGEDDLQDAWIPSITPEGQVFYVNVHTGETSWEIPSTSPTADADEDDFYFPNAGVHGHRRSEGDYYSTQSSSAHIDRDANTEESFRLPPCTHGEIPYPWVSRMSDDGSGYVYYNRITGQTRLDMPRVEELNASGGGRRPSPAESAASGRTSVEIQRRAVEDWEKKTRLALANLLKQADPPILATLIDNINDALRGIFEATVAGSAAEEEMSRAHDMGSESGMATAAMREEGAREALAEAHTATLALLRELLAAFGYVGPLDKMDDLPRPVWATDVTLIGSVGLLSSNVHAAVTSRVSTESGLTVWSEVMRTATRLKDVISDLPHRMSIDDDTRGKHLVAWLGVDNFDMLGGRWGFRNHSRKGSASSLVELRELDQELVLEVQRIKGESEAVIRSGDTLNMIRVASKLQNQLSIIDIASVIDIDGEIGNGRLGSQGMSRARAEDLDLYNDLVHRARQHLHDLDTAYTSIATHCVNLLSNPNTIPLTVTVDRCFSSLSNLLMVAREQHALLSQSQISGSIGYRAATTAARRQRPGSMASQMSSTSRTSRASRLSELEEIRRKARSMEQEYEDEERTQEQLRRREIERDRERMIASQSQTSLRQSISRGGHGRGQSHSQAQGHRQQPSASATSSSTSLLYKDTESDSGSQKGTNRSSFMRFMKGRSSEDDGGSRRTKSSKSNKLAKLLGEDSFAQIPTNVLPPQAQTVPAPLVPAPIPERPWYLGEDYDPSEIVFDDKGTVKAGTLRALVARLTPHGSTDTAFFQAFLLTFRSFTSGDDLMDLLLERYNIQPPPGLSPVEQSEWKKQKQTPIRLRVVNTIRSWLDVHYLEDQDASMLDRVDQFVDALTAEGSGMMAKQLTNLVIRRRTSGTDGPRRTVSGGLLSPPAPLIPRVPSGRSIRLLDIAPVELARQFTIIESLHFQRIRAIECLNKAWAKEEGPKSAPNVRWVILTANRMAGWVALQILSSKDVKVRASTMKYFVQTAIELRNLNNFSSMAGVVAGLNSAPITRLKRTKEFLSAKTISLKANLDATLDSSKNFANYKDMLKTINPPCVPFFGFYLSALTFIEDGNKDLVQPEGHTEPLINFFKRSLSADILRDIQQYQSQPYNLARCKPVYDYITNGLEVVEASGDLYEMSLVLEPREMSEEQKVQRMLAETGFL